MSSTFKDKPTTAKAKRSKPSKAPQVFDLNNLPALSFNESRLPSLSTLVTPLLPPAPQANAYTTRREYTLKRRKWRQARGMIESSVRANITSFVISRHRMRAQSLFKFISLCTIIPLENAPICITKTSNTFTTLFPNGVLPPTTPPSQWPTPIQTSPSSACSSPSSSFYLSSSSRSASSASPTYPTLSLLDIRLLLWHLSHRLYAALLHLRSLSLFHPPALLLLPTHIPLPYTIFTRPFALHNTPPTVTSLHITQLLSSPLSRAPTPHANSSFHAYTPLSFHTLPPALPPHIPLPPPHPMSSLPPTLTYWALVALRPCATSTKPQVPVPLAASSATPLSSSASTASAGSGNPESGTIAHTHLFPTPFPAPQSRPYSPVTHAMVRRLQSLALYIGVHPYYVLALGMGIEHLIGGLTARFQELEKEIRGNYSGNMYNGDNNNGLREDEPPNADSMGTNMGLEAEEDEDDEDAEDELPPARPQHAETLSSSTSTSASTAPPRRRPLPHLHTAPALSHVIASEGCRYRVVTQTLEGAGMREGVDNVDDSEITSYVCEYDVDRAVALVDSEVGREGMVVEEAKNKGGEHSIIAASASHCTLGTPPSPSSSSLSSSSPVPFPSSLGALTPLRALPWLHRWGKMLAPRLQRTVNTQQRCNHWPHAYVVGRKDNLVRTVAKFIRGNEGYVGRYSSGWSAMVSVGQILMSKTRGASAGACTGTGVSTGVSLATGMGMMSLARLATHGNTASTSTSASASAVGVDMSLDVGNTPASPTASLGLSSNPLGLSANAVGLPDTYTGSNFTATGSGTDTGAAVGGMVVDGEVISVTEGRLRATRHSRPSSTHSATHSATESTLIEATQALSHELSSIISVHGYTCTSHLPSTIVTNAGVSAVVPSLSSKNGMTGNIPSSSTSHHIKASTLSTNINMNNDPKSIVASMERLCGITTPCSLQFVDKRLQIVVKDDVNEANSQSIVNQHHIVNSQHSIVNLHYTAGEWCGRVGLIAAVDPSGDRLLMHCAGAGEYTHSHSNTQTSTQSQAQTQGQAHTLSSLLSSSPNDVEAGIGNDGSSVIGSVAESGVVPSVAGSNIGAALPEIVASHTPRSASSSSSAPRPYLRVGRFLHRPSPPAASCYTVGHTNLHIDGAFVWDVNRDVGMGIWRNGEGVCLYGTGACTANSNLSTHVRAGVMDAEGVRVRNDEDDDEDEEVEDEEEEEDCEDEDEESGRSKALTTSGPTTTATPMPSRRTKDSSVVFPYLPETYLLPADAQLLFARMQQDNRRNKRKLRVENVAQSTSAVAVPATISTSVATSTAAVAKKAKNNLWIVKPAASSCGRGIRLVKTYNEIYDEDSDSGQDTDPENDNDVRKKKNIPENKTPKAENSGNKDDDENSNPEDTDLPIIPRNKSRGPALKLGKNANSAKSKTSGNFSSQENSQGNAHLRSLLQRAAVNGRSCTAALPQHTRTLLSAYQKNFYPPPSTKKMIVSRYIANPLLINRRKFDLRIYVAVTSLQPLRAYVYGEGLARFCTADYESTDGSDNSHQRFAHLTNYSVNKYNKNNFVKNNDNDDDDDDDDDDDVLASDDDNNHNASSGCGNDKEKEKDDGSFSITASKWRLTQLYTYLLSIGVDAPAVFISIRDLLTRTIIAAYPYLLSRPTLNANTSTNPSGFELLGFDVLLDTYLKPWLMEVNLGPSLAASSPMDNNVKSQLLADVYAMVAPSLPATPTNTSASTSSSSSSSTVSASSSNVTSTSSLSSASSSPSSHTYDINTMLRLPPPMAQWPDTLVHTVAFTLSEQARAGLFTPLFPSSFSHLYMGLLGNQGLVSENYHTQPYGNSNGNASSCGSGDGNSRDSSSKSTSSSSSSSLSLPSRYPLVVDPAYTADWALFLWSLYPPAHCLRRLRELALAYPCVVYEGVLRAYEEKVQREEMTRRSCAQAPLSSNTSSASSSASLAPSACSSVSSSPTLSPYSLCTHTCATTNFSPLGLHLPTQHNHIFGPNTDTLRRFYRWNAWHAPPVPVPDIAIPLHYSSRESEVSSGNAGKDMWKGNDGNANISNSRRGPGNGNGRGNAGGRFNSGSNSGGNGTGSSTIATNTNSKQVLATLMSGVKSSKGGKHPQYGRRASGNAEFAGFSGFPGRKEVEKTSVNWRTSESSSQRPSIQPYIPFSSPSPTTQTRNSGLEPVFPGSRGQRRRDMLTTPYAAPPSSSTASPDSYTASTTPYMTPSSPYTTTSNPYVTDNNMSTTSSPSPGNTTAFSPPSASASYAFAVGADRPHSRPAYVGSTNNSVDGSGISNTIAVGFGAGIGVPGGHAPPTRGFSGQGSGSTHGRRAHTSTHVTQGHARGVGASHSLGHRSSASIPTTGAIDGISGLGVWGSKVPHHSK